MTATIKLGHPQRRGRLSCVVVLMLVFIVDGKHQVRAGVARSLRSREGGRKLQQQQPDVKGMLDMLIDLWKNSTEGQHENDTPEPPVDDASVTIFEEEEVGTEPSKTTSFTTSFTMRKSVEEDHSVVDNSEKDNADQENTIVIVWPPPPPAAANLNETVPTNSVVDSQQEHHGMETGGSVASNEMQNMVGTVWPPTRVDPKQELHGAETEGAVASNETQLMVVTVWVPAPPVDTNMNETMPTNVVVDPKQDLHRVETEGAVASNEMQDMVGTVWPPTLVDPKQELHGVEMGGAIASNETQAMVVTVWPPRPLVDTGDTVASNETEMNDMSDNSPVADRNNSTTPAIDVGMVTIKDPTPQLLPVTNATASPFTALTVTAVTRNNITNDAPFFGAILSKEEEEAAAEVEEVEEVAEEEEDKKNSIVQRLGFLVVHGGEERSNLTVWALPQTWSMVTTNMQQPANLSPSSTHSFSP